MRQWATGLETGDDEYALWNIGTKLKPFFLNNIVLLQLNVLQALESNFSVQ